MLIDSMHILIAITKLTKFLSFLNTVYISSNERPCYKERPYFWIQKDNGVRRGADMETTEQQNEYVLRGL